MKTIEARETLSVIQTIITERTARDESDWPAMRRMYDSHSHVHLSWFRGSGPEFVDESRRMLAERGWRARHRLSLPSVVLHEGKAAAEVGVAIDMRQPLDGIEVDLTSYGSLLYRARRTRRGWLISGLTMIYQRDTVVPVIPGEVPPLNFDDLNRHRSSYRYLSYFAEHSGGAPLADLPGTDRPDLVAAVRESTSDWLTADRE